jgi:low temperature requirement protein LtrA
MFVAMAALLVVALCVPGAFGDDALLFACAYGVVRFGQIGLFLIASRGNPGLRQSVLGLAGGTAVGVGLLLAASGLDGWAQGLVWALALALDMAEPFFFGSEGWSLEHPGHFAERHGLIIIIALGESIVAIGIGAGVAVDVGVVAAATLGIAAAAALWWLYFDVVALVAERSLARLPAGRERNERGRDSYSYLHFPMVAGIVLLALGLKKTVGDVEHELGTVVASAMLGGAAIYLLAHVAFRLRNIGSLNRQRLVCAIALVALIPLLARIPALLALAILTAALCGLVALEAVRFAEARARVRQRLAEESAAR